MKKRFRKTFPVPHVAGTANIIASPETEKQSLIGTAFDYIVRFHVNRLFPESLEERWVAEDASDRIKLSSGEYVDVDGIIMPWDRNIKPEDQYPDANSLKYTEDHFPKLVLVALYIDKVITDAKKLRDNFILTGNMTRDLIKISFSLATFDLVIRIGRLEVPPDIMNNDILDMENLFNVLVDSGLLHPKRRAFLNPMFGKGSALVGGADADLIIDDMLIDIKTTKSDSFTQNMYNQLLGYYALSSFDKRFDGIKRLGIYFSRYGTLRTVPVPDDEEKKQIINWFEEAQSAIDNKSG